MKKEQQKLVVLIVEDEQPLLAVIKKKLELSGFDTISARTVNQALDYLESVDKVDVIWLDHYLIGREDGLDFVVKVKDNKQWKKIPIFVVSNTASAEKTHAYLELGISKYYTKANYNLSQIIYDIKILLGVK